MPQDRVESVERALTILNCFTEEKPVLSLIQLAEQTGFYKSTILRLASSLERNGFIIRQSDGKFILGSAFIRLGDIARNNFSIEGLIRPVLEQLRDLLNESIAFYVRSGNKRICLYRANANRAILHQLEEGLHLPLEYGAGGRVLLAVSGEQGEPYETIRNQGWYASKGERDPEVASVAVPILNDNGDGIAALAVSGLISRFPYGRQIEYAAILKEKAEELAHNLDFQQLRDIINTK